MAGVLIAKLGGGGQDDFFITYRNARHLAAGEGLVFNPGEHHFDLTEPALEVVLAGSHLVFGVPIPWLGTVFTGLSLLVNALGLVVAYPILGVGFYPWYAIPVVVALLYGVAFAVDGVAGPLGLWATNLPRSLTQAYLVVMMLIPLAWHAISLASAAGEDTHLVAYRQAGRWLRDHTPPDAAVACAEVGVLGWESQRPAWPGERVGHTPTHDSLIPVLRPRGRWVYPLDVRGS